MRERILDEAKKTFRPEFLNRLDDVIVFRSFTKPDLITILNLEVEKVLERLRHKNLKLALDDKAKDFLVERGYDPQYGARPMRRSVERFLEDPLAEEILKGNLHEGEPITVTVDGRQAGVQPDRRRRGRGGGLNCAGEPRHRPTLTLNRRGKIHRRPTPADIQSSAICN